MLVLPVRNDPYFTFDSTLDGRIFRFVFRYNSLYDYFTFDLKTRNDEPLLMGKKLVINYEFIRRYSNERYPPGALVAVDTTGSFDRITLDNFGNEIKFIYISEGELNDIL